MSEGFETAKRLVTQLAKLMRRVVRRQDEIFFAVKRPTRGRPKDDPSPVEYPSPQKRGRKPKFTPELERGWMMAIDRAKARAAADGRTLTDADALRLHMRKLFTDAFIADGKAPREARQFAHAKARARERLPAFRKWMDRLRERLSRARRRARNTPR